MKDYSKIIGNIVNQITNFGEVVKQMLGLYNQNKISNFYILDNLSR